MATSATDNDISSSDNDTNMSAVFVTIAKISIEACVAVWVLGTFFSLSFAFQCCGGNAFVPFPGVGCVKEAPPAPPAFSHVTFHTAIMIMIIIIINIIFTSPPS